MAKDKSAGQQQLPLDDGPYATGFRVWSALTPLVRTWIMKLVRGEHPIRHVENALEYAGQDKAHAEDLARYVRECVAD